MSTANGVKRVWKLKKKLQEAGRRLASVLPSVSLDELRRVFDANTLEAILDGKLRIPESTLARSIKESLKGVINEAEVTLDEKRVEITGRYKRLGIELEAYVVGTDQNFEPLPAPGVLTMKVEDMDLDAGGLVLQRLLSLVILAVIRFIYGDRLVHEQLEDIEGVELSEGMLTFRLAEIPQVREVIERSVFGVRFGDLIQVTDIIFQPGYVEVHIAAADTLRRAALLLDPMARPGK